MAYDDQWQHGTARFEVYEIGTLYKEEEFILMSV
jgi:hypothetical protein